MDENIQKIIAEQMKKLPKDVVDAIISVDYKTKLQEITKRQRLLIDQAGKLEMETTLVMIGLEPLSDYIDNLQRELEVTNIKAKEIAVDVSEHIFKPIRDSLHAMNEEVEGDDDPEIAGAHKPPTHLATDSNDENLNRDQILSEIENPSLISKTPTRQPTATQAPNNVPTNVPIKSTSLEIPPKNELETLAEVPYQQDIKVKKEENEVVSSSVLETKMNGINITSRQIVDAKPEHKLPEVEKKKPSSGTDPYREEIK